MPILTHEEQQTLQKLHEIYYMRSVIVALEETYFPRHGIISSLNYLHEIIVGCKDKVELLLQERLKNQQIKDVSQARKSVVGNLFPNTIIYIFLRAKQEGLITPTLFATTKTKDKLFQDYITIRVGEETQKPDMDLVFYKLRDDNSLNGCVIVSLKTSLRERAGQTYKWKLLLEIATTDNPIKDKYQIQFNVQPMPKVCFATINFYDEINNPQHRGMFKFFDGSFIGKPINNDFITHLSELFAFADREISDAPHP